MSVEIREVKQRINGVRQISKVTSAMEKIASARIARDKAAVQNSSRYMARLIDLLEGMSDRSLDLQHPLMASSRDVKKICLVMFGSERGLCGGFNTVLMDKLGSFRNEKQGGVISLMVMGKIVHRRAVYQGFDIKTVLKHPKRLLAAQTAARPGMPNEISEIATSVVDACMKKEFDEVDVLYMKYISALKQVPTVEKLLPIDLIAQPGAAVEKDTGKNSGVGAVIKVASFEPEPSVLLERIVPEYIKRQLYHAFLHNVASETTSRQTAMRRATENADEMLEELKLTFSRLRQEDITTQMLELAGGSLS